MNASVEVFESAGPPGRWRRTRRMPRQCATGRRSAERRYTALELYDPLVGEEAWGIEFGVRVGMTTYHITGILLRRERVIGGAVITQTDATPVRAQVLELARTIDERIQGVLSGDVQPTPLAGAHDPRSLAMTRRDFSLTLSLARQGYFRNGGVKGYVQEFHVSGGRLGRSSPFSVRTVAQVFPSADAAREDQRHFESRAGRGTIVARYLESFLRGAVHPRGLESHALAVGQANGAAFVFTFEAPRGRVLGVMVATRAGSAQGNLTVMGRAKDMHPAGTVELLPRLQAHLAGSG